MDQLSSAQPQIFREQLTEEVARKRNLYNWRLVLTVSVASVYVMAIGGVAGYLSPALPDINDRPNPFHLNDDEMSWTGSIGALGGMLGGLASGTTCDILGRKVAIMSTSIFVVVGFTILAAATDYKYLYAGFAIVSVFSMINMSAATIYVSEVAPAGIRGTCMSLTTLAYSIGMVIAYAMGIPLAWNWLAIFLAAVMALPNVVLALLPESPRWFLLKGNREAAVHAVTWFQGVCPVDEIRAIEHGLSEASTADKNARCSCDPSWRDLVSKRENLKSLLVVSVIFILQGFSGNLFLQMYTVSIFQMAGVSDMDPNVQTIIVGLFSVVGSVVCPLLVDRIGRRMLMNISLITITLSMAAAGVFFALLDTDPDYAHDKLSWLPVVSLSASNFGYTLGLFPVGYILSCEMMPTNVRGSAQTVFMVIQGFASFGSIKTFIYIQRAIATSGAFFVFTAICAAGTMFVTFFVTKEKTHSTME